MVVAIDGPAGVGKSTVAHRIASEFGFHFLNSGNFYRCVAYFSLKNHIAVGDSAGLVRIADELNLSFQNDCLYCNGENIEPFLHTHEIDEIVAPVSAVPEVREAVNRQIRKLYSDADLVCEGRDMTTVVFPDAEVKIYLDAAPEIRAARRLNQGCSSADYQTILNSIKNRDRIDMGKAVGKLFVAEDALYIDTSDLDLDSVTEKILCYIKENRRKK